MAMKVACARPFECMKLTLILLFLVFVCATELSALSIVNQGPSSVDNFPPGNGVSVAVTTTITAGSSIQWGIRVQGGIEVFRSEFE